MEGEAMMPPMRLTEFVEDLCERGTELEDAATDPPVTVYCWVDGVIQVHDVEFVGSDADGRIVIHCRRPA
jgi:hypothetical protein